MVSLAPILQSKLPPQAPWQQHGLTHGSLAPFRCQQKLAGASRHMHLAPPCRHATPTDAAALADFVHFASEGLALYLWTKMAGAGGDPWAVGRERAARATGAFSYRNAMVMEIAGQPAAG